jgi:hypothetical protein
MLSSHRDIHYRYSHSKEYLSCMALRGANQSRFKKLKDDLSNNMTKGVDNFPKTLVEAMHLITDYKVPARAPRIQGGGSEGVTFIQTGGATGAAATAARAATTTAIECWHCGKIGHYKSNCPELTGNGAAEQGVQNLSVEDCNKGHSLLMTQDEEECALMQGSSGGMGGIPSLDHLYIDTCATYASTHTGRSLRA